MSILIRAALLGGLAYVVSRAVKSSQGAHRSYDQNESNFNDDSRDLSTWPTSDQPSTGNL